MRKLHVILKKEDMDESKQLENKIVVVFDILLATTTITTALKHGASEVIPVLNQKEALEVVKDKLTGSYELVGEAQGATIDGFLSPDPLGLKEKVSNKTVVLSTTNGTVALKKSLAAKTIYAASLLNSSAVAKKLLNNYQDETILLVCSGSSGEFCVEDFYGAGYFIHCLMEHSIGGQWDLTDSAQAALHFVKGIGNHAHEIFRDSRVGGMLSKQGMDEAIELAAQKDIYQIVPYIADRASLCIDEK
ncbi:2-phosphosulfolactate phosphatase [Oceanobacillus senegalensis]|uniref:2-phosphosulfolactate phosphatase n=1 Tax=Oceanobacillus senegalensis TaxID=1936063 RepID=UPI000A305C6F|nr:2-phosphosulfolactate phosphatase [Oceanobacillus senegalensis]